MDKQIEYLLNEALRDNILPLTGKCNLACLFCSHRFNPPGALVYDLPPLKDSIVKSLLENLDPSRKIVIGESVTRLREGEPFTFPDIMGVLRKIRSLYPKTPVQITTNGTLLTEEKLRELAALLPLELVFSLNSSSAAGRKILCGDREPDRALDAIAAASNLKIPFHGSVVAMPHVLGFEDLRQALKFIDMNNARTIRVFIPGFTRYAPENLQINTTDIDNIRLFLEGLRNDISIPILTEPPKISDTDAVIEGVLNDSPADVAGLMADDIIKRINGKKPLCRVEAYNMLLRSRNPEVYFERGSVKIHKILKKEANKSSGVAVNYDINPDYINLLKNYLSSDRKILLLTSEAASPLWHNLTADLMGKNGKSKDALQLKILTVRSNFFGGSIVCAGLLTVGDYRLVLERGINDFYPDTVMLPPASFDSRGLDITGESYLTLAELFPKNTKIIV